MTTFNQGDHVYLQNGCMVEYIEKTSAGHLVDGLSRCDDELYADGEPFVVQQVFVNEPENALGDKARQAAELDAKIRALRTQQWKAEREAQGTKEKVERALSVLAKYKGLELLRDYIDGKITHFAVSDSQGIRVSTWDDVMLYDDSFSHDKVKHIRFLQLYGDSKGDLTWGVNAYSNGTLGSAAVFPCTSEDMAKAKCQEMAIAAMDKKRADGMAGIQPWAFASRIETARGLGVEISEEDEKWLAGYKKDKAAQDRARLIEEREKIDAQLAQLHDGELP